ncbi:Cyclic nucleotide-gated ion channel 17, partial [Cucurbita argyrosperma subsp. argyrosperma]
MGMELRNYKLVRFYSDHKKHKESAIGSSNNEAMQLEKSSSKYYIPSSTFLMPDNGLGGIKSKFTETFKTEKSKVFPEDYEPWSKRILDPGSKIVLKWNRVFICSCLLALFVDPLYLYLPAFNGNGQSQCVRTDWKLRIVVTCFRTVADFFYLLHMIIKFRTAYVAPSSRVFGRGELVMDPKMIAKSSELACAHFNYSHETPNPTTFDCQRLVTASSMQIVIWFIIPATRSRLTDHKNNALALIVLLQYIPRLYLIFPLSSEIIKANGVVTKTAWAGAAYNLLLYMLASHVLGATWYLLSVDRYTSCWKSFCRKKEYNTLECNLTFFDCDTFNHNDRDTWANSTLVFEKCGPKGIFKYGIFGQAMSKNVVSSSFIEKYFYCLWWGLQNL